MKEKKMYAWMPSNCEMFDETYDSIEDAVSEAQKQWDEKYDHYEDEDEYDNTEIYLMTVRQYNPETYLERFGEDLIDGLDESLADFTSGTEVDSEVYCKDKSKFNEAVKSALMPLIKKHLTFNMDLVGDILDLTYNVETRKYTWQEKEYDVLPDEFKCKEE